MNEVGFRLRKLRKEKHKTLVEVNQDTGISFSGLAEIERGERSCNSTTLKILADYYGVSTDFILGSTDSGSSSDSVDLAFYNQHGIVSDEQKKEIESFIKFVKAKNEK